MASTAQPAPRVCEPFEPQDGGRYTCPDRCRVEQCALCLRDVHYDPGAAIGAPGPEIIICRPCAAGPPGQN